MEGQVKQRAWSEKSLAFTFSCRTRCGSSQVENASPAMKGAVERVRDDA